MELLQSLQKQGYRFGKITKLSKDKRLHLGRLIEYKQYDTFTEQLLVIAVAHHTTIPNELCMYKDEDYTKNAQAFLLGLRNGSITQGDK